ncbi:uncharacterized protein EI90DRAFT_3011824 [Cantharellus anzutake]|uniref:uncharacterized protein n=1 Tax=Cantharellus anzutake TaxID=1750568 RepID=UPI0019080FA1|nr:uncharacterized protein EI90DRAFT_3011824 [Cantharellus anzutake]KAF8342331.1 hypothetical protein EI90DRAFT_3011824 [Cantharellus anzutake]
MNASQTDGQARQAEMVSARNSGIILSWNQIPFEIRRQAAIPVRPKNLSEIILQMLWNMTELHLYLVGNSLNDRTMREYTPFFHKGHVKIRDQVWGLSMAKAVCRENLKSREQHGRLGLKSREDNNVGRWTSRWIAADAHTYSSNNDGNMGMEPVPVQGEHPPRDFVRVGANGGDVDIKPPVIGVSLSKTETPIHEEAATIFLRGPAMANECQDFETQQMDCLFVRSRGAPGLRFRGRDDVHDLKFKSVGGHHGDKPER